VGPSESSTPEPARARPKGDDGPAIELRRATEADVPQIIQLAHAALGWAPGDPNEEFFRWKHFQNPAGASPMWVAVAPSGVVGFRVFLRWTFTQSGRTRRAVRAVDTATHPDHQARGIFSRLTLGALDELRDEGVEFVFNTPNDRSRPGYLKMGWKEMGRVPIRVRPRGARSAIRMAGARVPAEKWSIPTDVGAAATALASDDDLDVLLETTRPTAGSPADRRLHTHLTAEHLRWRYRFGPLHYRAITPPGGLRRGLAVFRLRRRGSAVEAVVSDLLTADPRDGRSLLADIARSTGADYLIATSATAGTGARTRFVPVPRLGPILTWRQVAPDARPPERDDWGLAMGDVELF
jgi:GNAT superfamily N-acetyltransferase